MAVQCWRPLAGLAACLLVASTVQAQSPGPGGPVSITSPANAATVSGRVEVRGTAWLPPGQFASYQLWWGPVDDLTTLIPIGGMHTQPVRDNVLEVWDTGGMAEGSYALVLTATGADGRTYKNGAIVNVTFSPLLAPPSNGIRPMIISPRIGETVKGSVTVKGTAGFAGGVFPEVFQFYKVEYAPLASTDLPLPVSNIKTTAVANDVLDTWDTTRVADGAYWLVATVARASGQFQQARVPVFVRNAPVGGPA